MAKKEKNPIENKIYMAIIGHCEEMEHKGVYRGNGHHLAQRLVVMVSAGLLTKQEKKVFDAMEQGKQKTKDIADRVGLPSKVVSAILQQIQNKTILVHSTFEKPGNKKSKLWYK